MDICYIHPFLFILIYIKIGMITIATIVMIKGMRSVHSSRLPGGPKKFIPKKPATKESGINRVVINVNLLIVSFMRLLITER